MFENQSSLLTVYRVHIHKKKTLHSKINTSTTSLSESSNVRTIIPYFHKCITTNVSNLMSNKTFKINVVNQHTYF